MQDYIGENRTENSAKEIVEENFEPNNFDNLPAVNYWIKNNLKQVAAPDSVNITLTVEELKSMFKRQCKTTSLSPSGHHYGHYKVLLDNEDMLQVHSIMMSFPFQYGFTLTRWLKAVDVMLEKDPGSPKINCF
eukprot:2129617-Ditylum_brightwellii.AAC.1